MIDTVILGRGGARLTLMLVILYFTGAGGGISEPSVEIRSREHMTHMNTRRPSHSHRLIFSEVGGYVSLTAHRDVLYYGAGSSK